MTIEAGPFKGPAFFVHEHYMKITATGLHDAQQPWHDATTQSPLQGFAP
jgi:hypothetical protein